INRNYKVVSSTKEEYCLKVYSPRVRDNRLHDGLAVMEYLLRLNFPVPKVVKTIEAQDILLLDDQRYLLLRYLPGRNLLPSEVGEGECYALGATLAKLHHSLRFFPNANMLHGDLWKASKDALPRLYELLEKVQSRPQRDDFDSFALESLTHRIQVMRSIEVGPQQFSHLQRQALHGDYQLSNIIFDDNDKVVGIIDFDQTCYSFPAWELMRAIGFTSMPNNTFNYSFAHSILRGYVENEGVLSTSDYLEMPRLWYYQLLRGLFGLREHYTGSPDPRQDEGALGRHAIMIWLENNLDELKQFIWETVK
ncbi:MAG: phosphotransferase, partial [bacterium]|nr:phosphotransferase [bacterium]